jgi:hypothetical protein
VKAIAATNDMEAIDRNFLSPKNNINLLNR